MARLGDIATYVNGYAFKPSDWSDTGLPIIRIQDLTGNSYQANRYSGPYDGKYEVNKGDVLISWSASLGVYIWNDEKAVLNQHIFKVVFDKQAVNKSFFVHQVQNILEKAEFQAHGATMKHLTKPVFDSLPFYLPPMEQQQRIATILDKITDLISLRKQQLAKLDELVKARFVEMFGNVHHELPLNQICSFIDYRGKTPEKSDFGIPLITAKNVKENSFSVEPQEFIPQENYSAVMTRGTPKVNDVLFTTEAPLGNVCRIPNIYQQFCVGQRIITMQPMEGIVTSEYLEYALRETRFQNKLWEKASGSTVKGIRSKLLEWLTIPVPFFELQAAFTNFVHWADKQKLTIQQSLAKLEVLKKALMQEYFG